MTREEIKEHCKKQIETCEMWAKARGENPCGKIYEEHKMILELLEQEPCDDCISRQEAINCATLNEFRYKIVEDIKTLPSVTPKEKIGYCKDCKWWKDSDGAFRRGIGAESKCPINCKKVYEGNGYCFMFEPQESEVSE